MAAPSYTTDLQTYGSVTSTTGWAEATSMTSTDGSGEVDSDLAIYGTQCFSEAQRKSGLGSLIYTGTAPTWTSGWAYFIWFKFFAPNSLATKSNGGIRVLIGSSSANYRGWYVNGSDTYATGPWTNYAVDPEQTGLATQTQGSPTTTYNSLGIGCSLINGISKGQSYTVDIMRYGRGEARFTDGDLANGYAVFSGWAAVDDNQNTGRYGLFSAVPGGYLWKGLMSLGLTATAVDMRDSNVAISIEDTEFVSTTFNKIEVHNASSNVEWDTVNITALGTRSRGDFEAVDNATIDIQACTFTDMNTFIFQSNSTVNGSTFRRCSLITPGSGTFTNNLVTNCRTAISVTTTALSNVTGNSFVSDGSNHAVELTSIGAGSMTWDNELTGYDSGGSGGSPVTPTSTGNEAIYVNVTTASDLTINVADGATTPSIRVSAGFTGDVNVVAGLKSFKFTLSPSNTGYEWRIYSVTALGSLAGATELAGQESATVDNQTYSYSYSTDQPIAVQIIDLPSDYEENISYYTLRNSNQEVVINLKKDLNN